MECAVTVLLQLSDSQLLQQNISGFCIIPSLLTLQKNRTNVCHMARDLIDVHKYYFDIYKNFIFVFSIVKSGNEKSRCENSSVTRKYLYMILAIFFYF